MKKFLRITVTCIVIMVLICLVKKLDILDFSFLEISEEQLSNYSEYYFNQLELDEKKMYVRIDEAVKNKKENVFLGTQDEADLTDRVTTVLTAYFYDNPEYYYISNKYIISTRDFKVFKYSTVQLEYLISDSNEIETKNKKLEEAMDKLLNSCIKEGMTNFEKEVAIHDALIEHVSYYKYEDINTIPDVKHTAYGALVEGEAVCDGYSKAFKMLLEEVSIESIIVSGATDNVPHAWNMVKLDDEYYNVDVTSDKLDEQSNKYVIHTYFNVTDEIITKTHTFDEMFKYPKCNSSKYDYYTKKDFYLSYEDNMYAKLGAIISKQKSSEIFELKADERYKVRSIIDTLYDLNFNNWRSSAKTSVSYNKTGNIYVFTK